MGDTHSMNVTIPMELKAALDAAADMQDRSNSTVVKRALEHYLRCVDSPENPCPHRYDERGNAASYPLPAPAREGAMDLETK